MQKKISMSLVALYLFPWGIQCLVDNFISVYTEAQPFATAKTVGEVAAIGAIVTMISQLVWTNIAGKARDKSNVLMTSLIFLTMFSLLFLIDNITKPLLYLFVFLFYSCYMTHQPLIDTIASENAGKTKHAFGWFRSFASFGYAAMGLLFAVLPNDTDNIFLYVAILAGISAIISKTVSAPNIVAKTEEENDAKCMNKSFVCFLIYSFCLFMCSRIIGFFFSAYYCSTDAGLGGNIGVFSFLVSIGTFGEWLVMILFGKNIIRAKAKYVFMLIALAGIFRSGVIYLFENLNLVAFSVVFSAVWFGILWSAATPYIKKIVPARSFSKAQGIWTVTTSGIAPFVGSYLGGLFAESFGYRALFLAVAAIMLLLLAVTPALIKE